MTVSLWSVLQSRKDWHSSKSEGFSFPVHDPKILKYSGFTLITGIASKVASTNDLSSEPRYAWMNAEYLVISRGICSRNIEGKKITRPFLT